jgi:hypothetical protein
VELLLFLFIARLASIRCHKIPASSIPIQHLLGMTIFLATQAVIPSKAANLIYYYKLFYYAACIEGRRWRFENALSDRTSPYIKSLTPPKPSADIPQPHNPLPKNKRPSQAKANAPAAEKQITTPVQLKA